MSVGNCVSVRACTCIHLYSIVPRMLSCWLQRLILFKFRKRLVIERSGRNPEQSFGSIMQCVDSITMVNLVQS